ncbi:MAG: DNA polymerase III subunit delta [bacterium]|nr:DNA polymerase III subunit delta [bacterium]
MLGGKITVLYGENSFERSAKLAEMRIRAVEAGFETEKVDPDDLAPSDFVSRIASVSLFSEKRLIIVRGLSDNVAIWNALDKILPQISSDVHLCLVEEKIDKRSSFYKNFSKTVDFLEFKKLDKKSAGDLAEFARKLAKNLDGNLALSDAKFLIEWVGADEWAIKVAVERLAILGDFSRSAIEKYIPQNLEANTFAIFEMSLKGQNEQVLAEITKMKIAGGTDAGYQFLALLTSQLFNLTALKLGRSSGVTTAQIAKEIGANAWALGKMEQLASQFNREDLAKIAEILAEADQLSKSSGADIWDLIEGALLEIGSKNQT